MGFVGRESCRGGADVDSVLRWCGMESGRGNDVAITELPMSREMTGLGCDMAEAQCGGEGERATRELEADKDGGINGEVHVSIAYGPRRVVAHVVGRREPREAILEDVDA